MDAATGQRPERTLLFAALLGLAALAALVAAVLAGVWSGAVGDARVVRMLDEVPATVAPSAGAVPAPLRVLVASMVSPGSTRDTYARLIERLGARLGRRAVLLQRRTYFEANEAVRNGEVDLAFLCSGAFVEAESEMHFAEMLAVPVVKGQTTYNAALLAGAGVTGNRLTDLRGRSMAYVDPMSLTGRLWAQRELRLAGLSEEAFFSRIVYTGSHDRAVHAVDLGLVDAASVDELIFDAMVAARPQLLERIRVVERSPAFGMPPVVVSRQTDAALRTALQAALLSMHEDAEGRSVLAELGIDRFVAPRPDHFDSVRDAFVRGRDGGVR